MYIDVQKLDAMGVKVDYDKDTGRINLYGVGFASDNFLMALDNIEREFSLTGYQRDAMLDHIMGKLMWFAVENASVY